MGVAEHVFDVNIHGKSVTWHLFDVGGARGQRHSWVPYFDDANAIIFVAPVSAFDQVNHLFVIGTHILTFLDQYLEEDPRTNRIDDSLQLFTQICSNALLKSVHLVLFLSACYIAAISAPSLLTDPSCRHLLLSSAFALFFLQTKPIFSRRNWTLV